MRTSTKKKMRLSPNGKDLIQAVRKVGDVAKATDARDYRNND